MSIPLHVDSSEAILATIVLAILYPFLQSTTSHDCRVPIDAHLQVRDLASVIIKSTRFETGQDLAFCSQLTSLVDEGVVIGSHSIQRGSVMFEQRLVAFQFDLFDFLLSSGAGPGRRGRLRSNAVC